MNNDYYESMRDRPKIEDVLDRMETRLETEKGIRINESLNDCFRCLESDCDYCLGRKL